MSLWIAVDVFIGLVLVYLLMAMIGTSLQEAIASGLNLRGKCLEKALGDLLAHGVAKLPQGRGDLADAVSAHPLVNPGVGPRFPSYVAAGNFGTALIDRLLIPGSTDPLIAQVEQTISQLPDCKARAWLTTLVLRAGGDLDKLQAGIENWFDDAMDRVSGVYKRATHWYLLAFGIVASVALNVDTIAIAQALMNDPSLRANVMAEAQQVAKEKRPDAVTAEAAMSGGTTAAAAGASAANAASAAASDPIDAAAAASASIAAAKAHVADAGQDLDQLRALGLPIGWKLSDQDQAPPLPANRSAWLIKVLGLLITALAVSLGAPFWFDLLQNVMNLRVSGPKPEKSDKVAG